MANKATGKGWPIKDRAKAFEQKPLDTSIKQRLKNLVSKEKK
jgi:hypothetical protein